MRRVKIKKIQGFTLLELMVTVVIMAIMAAIALPNMRNFVANTRVVNRSEQIANLFRFAKGEAVRMGAPVIVCGVKIRSDGRPAGECNSKEIQNGMMAYADKDLNGKYDSTKDIALRTITVNGVNVGEANKVVFVVDACGITGKLCDANDVKNNEFIFLPNGMFGYRKGNATINDYSNLTSSTNSSLGGHYVRFLVADSARKDAPSRYVVIAPSGSATVCNPIKANSDTEQGDMARICKLPTKKS